MANLGQIINRYPVEKFYKQTLSFFGGEFSATGTVAKNNILTIVDVIAINQRTLKVVGIVKSSDGGQFSFSQLTNDPHTIVGVDRTGALASDAITVIPT